MKLTLILFFLSIVLLNYGQRIKYGFYNNLDEAIADSGLVKSLYVDFNIEEESYPVKRQGWKFDFLDIETSIIV